MFLNMLGFLRNHNKNKHDWSLEHASLCLNYNIKDTVKLIQKLDNIYKREANSDCIKRLA